MTGRAALLFDLDGTLVDSDTQHLAAFQRAFARHGIELGASEYAAKVMGASNAMIARAFLSHLTPTQQAATIEAKEEDYRNSLDEVEPIAGAVALLDFADRHRLERAVVTNAPRANAEKVLAALGIGERLPIVVIGSELPRSKPDPLPYLKGLERTGADAGRSVAFEDSLSGVRAAAAAGLAAVGLTTTLGADVLLAAGATIAAADFTDPQIWALIAARCGANQNDGLRS
ncbi:MAG: HAD family phosphatase [Hyphomicrobiales bacterium]|nr:HAD family phosphatase [Hyphomicrobiales bacterium]